MFWTQFKTVTYDSLFFFNLSKQIFIYILRNLNHLFKTDPTFFEKSQSMEQ
jgi:hypothetical protein